MKNEIQIKRMIDDFERTAKLNYSNKETVRICLNNIGLLHAVLKDEPVPETIPVHESLMVWVNRFPEKTHISIVDVTDKFQELILLDGEWKKLREILNGIH